MKWRAVWPQEGQHAIESAYDGESTFVNSTMMASAQQYEVVEARGATICPVMYVVGVASAGRAAREATTCVTGAQSSAD